MKRPVACTLPVATALIALGFLSARAEEATPSPPADEASAEAVAESTPAAEPAPAPAAATTSVAPEITKPPGGWRAIKKGDEI